MKTLHRVYLIPGFFGFANFGDLKYFAHVRNCLEAVFARRNAAVEIHYVPTLPTASLRRRAARLAQVIAETGGERGPLHLLGHSTGGLDARLLVSPGVSLPGEHTAEELARRVRTVVTIATPHFGAPQASMFIGVLGQSLLRALSLLTLHGIRLGSVPLPALLAVAGALPRMGKLQGPILSILDQVYSQLLRDFDEVRRHELETFFLATSQEQALLSQLSPESMDVFNAAATRRPGVRYACVVARGRPPAWRAAFDLGPSPTLQATYALYRALYRLAGARPEFTGPDLTPAQSRTLEAAYGDLPDAASNDAIVPTLSQLFGDVVHATWGDHLDIIGHFWDPHATPPHVDWLTTHSGFDRRRFRALWSDVGEYVIAE